MAGHDVMQGIFHKYLRHNIHTYLRHKVFIERPVGFQQIVNQGMVFGTRFYFTYLVSVFSFNCVTGDPCTSETLTATKETKHLTSPGYPLGYKNNLKCKWEIIGQQSSKIKVKILSTDIDGQGSCDGDYVEVLDGSTLDVSVASLGSFCGVSTPSFTSSGPIITIRFTTDGSGTSKGFRLQYHYEDPQTPRTVVYFYVLGIIVGIIFFFFILFKMLTRYASKRHNDRIELETRYQARDTEMPTEVVEPIATRKFSNPPPTYNEAVNFGFAPTE